jgi:hypothetical protein
VGNWILDFIAGEETKELSRIKCCFKIQQQKEDILTLRKPAHYTTVRMQRSRKTELKEVTVLPQLEMLAGTAAP